MSNVMPLGKMMTDCLTSAGISSWIPVVGTLLGASIGFIGGLFNSWLTNKNREATEKGNRERARIENLYETLVEIKLYYQGMLGDMLSKVHHNTQNTVKNERSSIPPLVKLDMVLDMYFPELADAHKQFLSVKDSFGKKIAENLMGLFSDKTLEEKQKICGEYATLFNKLDNEISNLQQKLASLAKA